MIGIDRNTWLVYEGVSNYGHGVWPTPVISIASLITRETDWGNVPTSPYLDNAQLIFREDYYDPVTRVRRGRLYEFREGSLQQMWYFPPHPAEPVDRSNMKPDGRLNQILYTYQPARIFTSLAGSALRPELVLGTKSASTVWQVISVETIASGDELVTLRARSTFGALPDLVLEKIPERAKSEVLPLLSHVADAVFRSSPVSLVDLCRAAATAVFAQWLDSAEDSPTDIHHLDLGGLLKRYEQMHGASNPNSPSVVCTAGRLLLRFHSRGKPNEQKRYGTRVPTEEDAQLVLSALGLILRELEWAR